MKIVIQKVNVISPGSIHHLKEKDILINGDKIESIEAPGTIKAGDAEIISGKNFYVSPGWFDLHVNFCEPGNEFKEDIESGCKAASQGGFTGVLIMPSTDPSVSTRSSVEFILLRSKNSIVNVHVAGSISEQRNGKDLSEMYDMYQAGVRVFTDDKHAIQDGGLMSRALQYVQNFGGKIFSYAEDKHMAGKGFVNEGISSTLLGLKGIPSVAEELMISRDISLAQYTGSPVHFSTVSTRGSVELIRLAKKKGMKITADVSAMHLALNDDSLNEFETVYKIKPPLRSESDREALIDGLADGTIDCICSDHSPQDIENKKKEFELAAFGAAGIETAFGAARNATLNKLSLPELIAKFTTHARACAGLKPGMIEKGQPADLTVFDPNLKWTVNENHLRSKSKNNPFIGKVLTGKSIAVINRGLFSYCT